MTTFQCLPAKALTQDHIQTWRTLQQANPTLSSPYFCPEFTLLSASVRDDIFVTVIKENEDIVGFFPWQRQSQHHARPVAGTLSDYHGLISAPDLPVDVPTLLQACSLSSWEFDHLLASQANFVPYSSAQAKSPVIDLTNGFDAYYAQRLEAYPKRFKDMARLERLLAKEVGPLRYESHVSDLGLLHQLLQWKSEQFLESGLLDIFSFDWAKNLVHQIHATQTPNFSGQLSVLYAGDEVVAMHMGMRSYAVWHYWFPSYDERFKKYSPGLLLLLEIAKDSAHQGLKIVDMGKGESNYKSYFSNGDIELCEGSAVRPSLWHSVQTTLTTAAHQAAQVIRSTPLVVPARIPAQAWRQYRRRQLLR
jgi:CelD/BcsL family acetyltransferase involved in cellulose biosynthesis